MGFCSFWGFSKSNKQICWTVWISPMSSASNPMYEFLQLNLSILCSNSYIFSPFRYIPLFFSSKSSCSCFNIHFHCLEILSHYTALLGIRRAYFYNYVHILGWKLFGGRYGQFIQQKLLVCYVLFFLNWLLHYNRSHYGVHYEYMIL